MSYDPKKTQIITFLNTSCRLSATAYSIYLQLPSILEAISSICDLRTRRAAPRWRIQLM